MSIEHDSRLLPYLAQKLGGTDLRLENVWQNTEGWSMETFSLTVEYETNGRRVERDIILRRQPVSGLLEPYDVSTEYRVLTALQHTGVAIPKTFWFEADPNVFQRPFYAMEKVDGRVHFLSQHTDPNYRSIPDDAEWDSIARDFVTNLARIHGCDWRGLGLEFLGNPGPGKGSALLQVDRWATVIERAGYGHKPLVTLAINWLRNNAPENDTVCLVHGDYRSGNYIFKDEQMRAILDWEMLHLGDPHEDLVYVVGALCRSPAAPSGRGRRTGTSTSSTGRTTAGGSTTSPSSATHSTAASAPSTSSTGRSCSTQTASPSTTASPTSPTERCACNSSSPTNAFG